MTGGQGGSPLVPHRLLRQCNLLSKSLNSRIVTKQREFRCVESSAYSHCPEFSQAVQCLQRTILVAQAGIDECLRNRIRSEIGCEFLSVLPSAGPPVSVTEITGVGVANCREDLD